MHGADTRDIDKLPNVHLVSAELDWSNETRDLNNIPSTIWSKMRENLASAGRQRFLAAARNGGTLARLFMPRDIVVCSVDSGPTQRQAIVNANANVQLPFENIAMEYNPSWINQTLRDGDYAFSPTLLLAIYGL